MNLSEARTALAAAVSEIHEDVTCVSHPVPGNLRVGDAWVTAGRRTYSPRLRADFQVLSAFVVLGADERQADTLVDAWSGPLLACVADLYAGDVSVEPQQIITTTPVPGATFALALTATFELSE